jgi:hypothetical protein
MRSRFRYPQKQETLLQALRSDTSLEGRVVCPNLTRGRSCCIKVSKGELCESKRENDLDWQASAGVAGR